MKRQIQVKLGEQELPLGELRYDRQGQRERAAFAYSSSWLTHNDRFSIDPALPLVSGFQFDSARNDDSIFHGAIADTEPDGWGRKIILRDHAKRMAAQRIQGKSNTTSALGEVDFLLAVDDESRMGALRFYDEENTVQRSIDDGKRRTPPLIELSQILRSSQAIEMSKETAQDLAYLQGKGTSLGGLRPKCSVRDLDGHLAIGKFPSVSDQRSVTKGEVLALKLAELAGIETSEARVEICDDQPIAVIRRFDRRNDGSRIPYISAATLLGAGRNDSVEHTYTEIVDAIRVHGNNARNDIKELYRRIIFSILINNVDDHLHNHGFLHVHHNLWRLAPAFDINPFPDRAKELKTWISHDTGPEASLKALHSEHTYFGLEAQESEEIISAVSTAVSTWKTVGKEIGMTSSELAAFEEAFPQA